MDPEIRVLSWDLERQSYISVSSSLTTLTGRYTRGFSTCPVPEIVVVTIGPCTWYNDRIERLLEALPSRRGYTVDVVGGKDERDIACKRSCNPAVEARRQRRHGVVRGQRQPEGGGKVANRMLAATSGRWFRR